MRRVRHGARWSVGHEFSFLNFTTGEMRDDIRDDTDPLDVTSHEPPKNFTSNFALRQNFVRARRYLPNFASRNREK